MPRLKLTDKFIRNVTCKGDGRDEYLDSVVSQLMLRVTPAGNKSFSLLTRFPGYEHPTRRLLGPYYDGALSVLDEPDAGILDRDGAALTLAEAREKAMIWLGMIARGRDPGAEKRALKAAELAKAMAEREVAQTAFEKVAALWIKRKCAGLKQELEIYRLVENEFVSRWKGRPIAQISRDEYRLAIREIAERAPFQGYNSLGHLRRLLDWAEQSGEFSGFVSPLKDIKPAAWIDARKQPRSRILSSDELRAVWRAAVEMGYPWGSIVQLLILSAQRLREISDLSWPEIDMDGKVITIPAHRMKGGAPHLVPIAPQARALLESVPRFPGPYVFSLTGGVRSVGGFSRPKRLLDELSGVTGTRLHDLRRTARSGFSALAGFEDHVREAVIDHRRSGIARVYDLHNYFSAKLDLLTQWEQRLLAIVDTPAGDMREAAG
jgi:integrase